MNINWIMAVLLITVVPLLMGVLLTELTDKERTIGRTYVYGWISLFAVMEIISLPIIFMGKSLTVFTVIVSVICLIIIGAGVFVSRKNIVIYAKNTFELIKKSGLFWVIPIGLIAVQMFFCFMKVHSNADDAFYLATANTAVATDSIFKFNPYTGELYTAFPARYVLSPLPVFYAVISKLSGLHIAIVAHTLIPVVLIMVTYFVYIMIGRSLFENDMKKTGVFIFFVALIFSFSAITTHTTGVVFLTKLWQGKAMLAAFLVPLIMSTLFECKDKRIDVKNCILLMVILLACSFVSSMGILLGPLCLAMALLAYLILYRKILYVLPGAVSCIPSAVLAVLYILIK